MTRLWYVLLLAAAAVVLGALPADGYQFLSQQVSGLSGVSPDRWLSLPIDVTVDNGPTDVFADVNTALATWNNVPTAQNPWGTATRALDAGGNPLDFNSLNFETSWGNLTGDGRQEVVVDETGAALLTLGFAPEAVNGFGARHEVVTNGKAAIDDMYLILNGSRSDYDRRSTEVHELGHTLGLAHSTVGFMQGKDGALSEPLESQVPTMHPFGVAGDSRQSLEADDVAAISELYPGPTFSTTTGTIAGSVLRCDTGGAVNGANVRVINVNNPAIQLTRVTGFDGTTGGGYEIKGVPPGDYFVVVEPLTGDVPFVDRLAMFTDIDTDFTQEYHNATKEDDCAADTDLNDREPVAVAANGTKIANFKVTKATLALVIDVTGSMGPEIGAIKAGLETMITALQAAPGAFPDTAIVTFEDSASVRTVSHDPSRLRSVIAGLTTHSTPDCPEGSNAALMTAGRLLGSGGRALLITDANSHPNGPSRESVDAAYAEKGARISVLLSGTCPLTSPSPKAKGVAALANGGGAAPDEAAPVDALGKELSIRTFSEESLFSGGLFSFQQEIKTAAPDAVTRYSNTLANIGISSVRPAVAALYPSVLPRGTSLELELTGSNTGFRGGSTLAVAGSGVTVAALQVLSPTRIAARLTVAPDAALGFRDVTVTTDRGDGSTETARGIGAIQVTGPPAGPTVLSVTPSTGAVGTTEDVTISGGLTHFAGGSSAASFGPGVTVSSLTVVSPTSAVARVTIGAGADVGFRDVSVQTGAEHAGESVSGPFLVTAAPPPVPRLTSASPASGARGATLNVTLTGVSTAFATGRSVASISGAGVQVLSTTFKSPTEVVAALRIAADAPLGFRDLKVTTGGATATLLDGFEVRPAAIPATPTPVATAAATPTPPPAACTDRTAPAAFFTSVRSKKRKLQLRGRASDAGCGGAVARVEVAISRKAGSKCRFLGANGKLTSARRCTQPVFLKATGTTSWSLATKRPLARGAYTVQVRARDRAGNLQRAVSKRVTAR
jgi:hypothetical protein